MARWEESPSPARASNQRHAQSHSTSRWAVCTRIAIAVIIVIIVIRSSSIFARTVKVGHELLDLLPVFLRGLVVLVRLAALSDRVPVHVRDALVRVPRKSRNGDHVSAVGGGLAPLDLDFSDHVCDSGTWRTKRVARVRDSGRTSECRQRFMPYHASQPHQTACCSPSLSGSGAGTSARRC